MTVSEEPLEWLCPYCHRTNFAASTTEDGDMVYCTYCGKACRFTVI
jgi:phage FluMu protein Com